MNKKITILIIFVIISSFLYPVLGETTNQFSFGVIGDPHRCTPSNNQYLDDSIKDLMNNTALPQTSFLIDVGDTIQNRIEAIYNYTGNYGDARSEIIDNLHVPYMWTVGNHDYLFISWAGEDLDGDPRDDGGNLSYNRGALDNYMRDEIELVTPSYAYIQNNILFICIEQLYTEFTCEQLHEWAQNLIQLHSDKTVVIQTHNIMDTGLTSGANSGYRSYEDYEHWEKTLSYSNVKLYIHGHNHEYDSVRASSSTNANWGHDVQFIEFPHYRYALDILGIINISSSHISCDTWESSGGTWTGNANDFNWSIATSYDSTTTDSLIIPIFMQDNETVRLPNKYITNNITLQYMGRENTSLFQFYKLDKIIDTSVGGVYDKFPGIENSDTFALESNSMEIDGGTNFYFPSRGITSISDVYGIGVEEIGHAIPGETYDIRFQLKSDVNKADAFDLSMITVSNDSNVSTYTGTETSLYTNEGTTTSYQWFNTTYTVPNNNNCWFLVGNFSFESGTTYNMNKLIVKRNASSTSTSNMCIKLNNKWYPSTGILNRISTYNVSIDPDDFTDNQGNITLTANISGNKIGIANIILSTPLLVSRCHQLRIDDTMDNSTSVTRIQQLSAERSITDIFPFSLQESYYSNINVTSGSVKTTSNNHNYFTATNDHFIIKYGNNPSTNFYQLQNTSQFEFYEIPEATTYHIQVASDSEFSNILLDLDNISEGCDLESMPGGDFSTTDGYVTFTLPNAYEISYYGTKYCRIRCK